MKNIKEMSNIEILTVIANEVAPFVDELVTDNYGIALRELRAREKEKPKLQIPKWIARLIDERMKLSEGMNYVLKNVVKDLDANVWLAKADNNDIARAYINKLTRPFVEVVG